MNLQPLLFKYLTQQGVQNRLKEPLWPCLLLPFVAIIIQGSPGFNLKCNCSYITHFHLLATSHCISSHSGFSQAQQDLLTLTSGPNVPVHEPKMPRICHTFNSQKSISRKSPHDNSMQLKHHPFRDPVTQQHIEPHHYSATYVHHWCSPPPKELGGLISFSFLKHYS